MFSEESIKETYKTLLEEREAQLVVGEAVVHFEITGDLGRLYLSTSVYSSEVRLSIPLRRYAGRKHRIPGQTMQTHLVEDASGRQLWLYYLEDIPGLDLAGLRKVLGQFLWVAGEWQDFLVEQEELIPQGGAPALALS